MKPSTIIDPYNGREVEPAKVGTLVRLDGRNLREMLLPCEFPELAPFRYPSYTMKNTGGAPGWPCRIEVTGRKVVTDKGCRSIRVRVTVVGDGEPDRYLSGYMVTEPYTV